SGRWRRPCPGIVRRFKCLAASEAYHPSGIAADDAAGRYGLHHHRADSNDSLFANALGDCRAVANPDVPANRNALVPPTLQADRDRDVIEVVLVFARDDVDIGPDEYVVPDRSMCNHAACADVNVLADLDLGRGEEGAKANDAIRPTARQCASIKSATEQVAGEAGKETEELRKPLKDLVAAVSKEHRDDEVREKKR